MDFTNDWELYEKGVDFKTRINLYKEVEDNNRFFQGDQWHGVKSEGLPTPVFNIIKPVIRYKVSAIMQNNLKIKYAFENYNEKDSDKMVQVCELLTQKAQQLWEQLKMDFHNEEMLKDGAISGDGVAYFYYDDQQGKINLELIDNTNIYPSNPNYANIQQQDYIIIAFRRTVDSVREEALSNGVKKELTDMIVSDDDTMHTAGAIGKIEQEDSNMCTVLLKLWKDNKTNTIHFTKSSRDIVICDDKDTGCELYPIAMLNWESRKNCFHGASDVTGLIPNQLYINKIAAMVMLSTMYTAFPKMVYDENLVDNPSNQIGVAIGVNGADKPINSIIDYITPSSVSNDAFGMFERTIALTKELMGANDGALGAINPENASGKAIQAVMEQAAQPLESVKRRFYNYVEDVALIWADIIRAYCSKELLSVKQGDKVSSIDANILKKILLSVKVEVGPSTKWSELATIESLDQMLNNNHITFEMYLELLPKNCGIPKERILELIREKKPNIPKNEDEVIEMLSEQERMDAIKNPQIITDKLTKALSVK
ncbi:MAG: hypothetical protein J6V58_01350 [Clostridia bacterium]|nr:hypothetical protein [Clostridia bacterium]